MATIEEHRKTYRRRLAAAWRDDMRMEGGIDKWGTNISLMFLTAEVYTSVLGSTPSSWDYSPGAGIRFGAHKDDEWEELLEMDYPRGALFDELVRCAEDSSHTTPIIISGAPDQAERTALAAEQWRRFRGIDAALQDVGNAISRYDDLCRRAGINY